MIICPSSYNLYQDNKKYTKNKWVLNILAVSAKEGPKTMMSCPIPNSLTDFDIQSIPHLARRTGRLWGKLMRGGRNPTNLTSRSTYRAEDSTLITRPRKGVQGFKRWRQRTKNRCLGRYGKYSKQEKVAKAAKMSTRTVGREVFHMKTHNTRLLIYWSDRRRPTWRIKRTLSKRGA